MSIEHVTFTGVDAWTDMREVQMICKQYPRAEFGILVGSESFLVGNEYRNNPRFLTLGKTAQWVYLQNHSDIKLALHICPGYMKHFTGRKLQMDAAILLARRFQRIQINDTSWTPDEYRHFADEVDASSVILQTQSPSWKRPVKHPRIEYLFDPSRGDGKKSWHLWPNPPDDGRRVGYAGGIRPEPEILDFVRDFAERHKEHRIWFDMESGVRDDRHRFDLEKVKVVCRHLIGSG